MKFFINLGPNWEEASVKATNVTEKTVPATLIIAPEIVDRMLRAEAELFTRKKLNQLSCDITIELSKITKIMERRIAKQIISTGRNQNVVSNSFPKKISFFML